jgi:hypothetical protein
MGPSSDLRRRQLGRASGLLQFKRRARLLAKKKLFKINQNLKVALKISSFECCRLLHRSQKVAELLCSAQK